MTGQDQRLQEDERKTTKSTFYQHNRFPSGSQRRNSYVDLESCGIQ